MLCFFDMSNACFSDCEGREDWCFDVPKPLPASAIDAHHICPASSYPDVKWHLISKDFRS